MVPQVPLAPELLSELLINAISEFEDLVHEEGEKIQEEEVEGEALLSMPEVVLDVVALVL